MGLAGGARPSRELLLKPAKAVKRRVYRLMCKHYSGGTSAWYLVKRLNGYAVYRCSVCGATRTVAV